MNLEIEIVEHLNKASEFLKAAALCLNANLWNASVSRSYYSIYHTAIAVILYRHHGGVRHPQWSHEFTSAQFSKIVSRSSQFGRKMTDAILERHKADYGITQVSRRLSRRIFNDAKEIYDWAIYFIDIGEFQELLEVYEDDFNVGHT